MEIVTKENLKEAYPELFAEIFADGVKAGYTDGFSKGKVEGAQEEQVRIKAVEEQLIPGHEVLIATLKYDGKTSGPEAAVQVLNAEKKIRSNMADKIASDAINPLPQPNPPVGGDGVDPNLPVEERAKQKWDKDPTIREEFRTQDAYLAFLKQSEAGHIRILKKETK